MVETTPPEVDEQILDAELEKLIRVPPAGPPEVPPDDDGGIPPDPQGEPARPLVRNAYLGMAAFLGAEAMFFAGLIGAFLVFRFGSQVWPPPFQPRLPLAVTSVNTAVLLLSAFTMARAWRAWKRESREGLVRNLLITSVLGTAFLLVQGSEWARLIYFGLTISSGVYGGTFYTLIGAHGLHVLGAVIWLLSVFFLLRRAPFVARSTTRLALCAVYWYFVVGLWPVLFGLVYLS
ncbi:MAG: heme-copper oxidase subunit III [Nitrospinota bacterium]